MLLEGGPKLSGSFLDAGEVDEMRIFIAPIAVGGRAARVSVEGEGSDSIEHARRAGSLDVQMSGDDVLLSARFVEW
jgi:diaminohydroxyphosphoribosylaminopyrimidine deaminase/5-amino-6-(5-phosphoribosylamino)uracil reductase